MGMVTDKSAIWRVGMVALSALMVSGSQAYAETLQVKALKAVPSQYFPNEPAVSVQLTEESTLDFARFTAARVGKHIHVKLDGELLVSPGIGSPLVTGQMIIQVGATAYTAKEMADRILSGGKLTVEDEAGE